MNNYLKLLTGLLFLFILGCTQNQTRPTQIPSNMMNTTNTTIKNTDYEVRNTTNNIITTATYPAYILRSDINQTQNSYSDLIRTVNQYRRY